MMKLSKIIALLPTLVATFVHSQEITSISLRANRIAMGTNAELSISYKSTRDLVWCGLTIDWGDGEKQDIRIGDTNYKSSPISISHTYSVAGDFFINAQGRWLARGLNSATACEGSLQPARLSVIDVQAARAAQKQREILLQKRHGLKPRLAKGSLPLIVLKERLTFDNGNWLKRNWNLNAENWK